MGKRAASLQPVCFTACLDVDLPVDSQPGVLCSIENVVAGQKHHPEGLKSPAAKKQRCLELDQNTAVPKPLDASFVFSKARSLLRQPPPGADDTPIGREKQSKQLEDIVTSFMGSSSGNSVYVSGLPGTGEQQPSPKPLFASSCCLCEAAMRELDMQPVSTSACLQHCYYPCIGGSSCWHHP
jgi:hypothetical protein